VKRLYDVPDGTVVYRDGGPARLVEPDATRMPAASSRRGVVVSYRASKSFSYESRHVAKDEVLEEDDPLVPVVLSSHPGVLLVTVSRGGRSDESGIDFRPDLVDRNFELRISSGARATIEQVLCAVAGRDLETGGYLYSFSRPRYRGAVVDKASDPGPDSRLRANGVFLSDPERVESEWGELSRRALDHGLRPVGDFHSHPGGSGEPSDNDRRAWARALEDHRLTYYIGLICTRSSDALGWQFPNLHPWIARGGPKGVEILRARLID
jgi:proteasome lid subunit RPN8/RPN11